MRSWPFHRSLQGLQWNLLSFISQILPELLILHLLIYSASLHPYLAFWLSSDFYHILYLLLCFMILHFFFGLTPTFLVCFRF